MSDTTHLDRISGSPADPVAPAAGPRPWLPLQRAASTCTLCRLHETRTHVVFGEGDPEADMVLVGEGPGRNEDLTGRPFVGAAGNLLENLLTQNGLQRDDVYITNVVKCRPPGNRDPLPDEVATCSPYLREQMAHLRPKVIVTLGNVATRLILGKQLPISRVAGYRFDVMGTTLIPTFHPAAALRGSTQAMRALQRDIRLAKAVADGRVASAREALEELRTRQAAAPR